MVLQKLKTSVVLADQTDSCLILLLESYFCGIIGDSAWHLMNIWMVEFAVAMIGESVSTRDRALNA